MAMVTSMMIEMVTVLVKKHLDLEIVSISDCLKLKLSQQAAGHLASSSTNGDLLLWQRYLLL